MIREFSEILVDKNVSIKEALKLLDKTAEKILFIVDSENKFIGSLSDGDIRRWILKDGSLSALSGEVCFKDTYVLEVGHNHETAKKEMLARRISMVPVLDRDNRIVEILAWDKIFGGKIERKVLVPINNPVVIMAGGKGTRLDPFTKVLPKPLIPIGDKTILEIIMDKFVDFGVNEFTLSLNYKAKIIKSYFEEISPDFTIKYIYETEPLGTAGALGLMKFGTNTEIIVTNCDIIIDADYADLMQFHCNRGYDITIVGSIKHIQIPYGVCKLSSNGLLDAIEEKPEYDYLISTGMYVINSQLLNLIPEKTVYHMTDLISTAQSMDKKVGLYPISENSWIDTGEWVEYQKAVKKLLN